MPLTCPNCKCHEIESLSVIFNTEGRSCGAQGPRQTALVELSAPPKKGSYFIIFECWFVATMVMDLVSKSCRWPEVVGSSLISAIFFASVFALVRAFMFNKNVWPQLNEKWEQSYICLGCDSVFESPLSGQGRRNHGIQGT